MKTLAAAITALALTGAAAAQIAPTPLTADAQAAIDGLMAAGLSDDRGLDFVEDLTTEIGPRLAGSDAEARARDWAVARLEAMGFDNVRTEAFEIPFWSRITEEAELLGDNPQKLIITALGGSASTPVGGVEAEVVEFPSMAALRAADPTDVDGKIVFINEFMTRTQDGSGYGFAVRKRRNCAAVTTDLGGVACLIRSVGTQSRRFPHTGMMARGEATGPGPAAAPSPISVPLIAHPPLMRADHGADKAGPSRGVRGYAARGHRGPSRRSRGLRTRARGGNAPAIAKDGA
ncbi:MAG: hypothetical protein AAFQ67_06510, partial [Pseudomonadota bacterium]